MRNIDQIVVMPKPLHTNRLRFIKATKLLDQAGVDTQTGADTTDTTDTTDAHTCADTNRRRHQPAPAPLTSLTPKQAPTPTGADTTDTTDTADAQTGANTNRRRHH